MSSWARVIPGRALVAVLLLAWGTALAAPARPKPRVVVFEDFEDGAYRKWKVEGEAFGTRPATGTFRRQNRVSGWQGKFFVNTYWNGSDRYVGRMVSRPFTITERYITFLIGGGNFPGRCCLNLMVGGKVAHTATGSASEQLDLDYWDVKNLIGKQAHLEIVDRESGGWGHINVDHIVFTNVAPGAFGEEPPGPQLAQRAGVDEIIFAVRRVDPDGHWYANFGYWSANPSRKMYHDGGRLCRLNLRTGEVKALLEDPSGGVRDPQVHYDGRKILFSYRKGGQPYYHLYEISIDGTGLRQLTDGPFDDMEPAYLPDGDIIYCSSRAKRYVNCYFTHVAVLHRCDGNGGNVRMLSANVEQDNTPWVLPDGRVLYTRWEYVDRSQVAYHHLWTMNPDGTNQMIYFGNQNPSTVMIDAKPIAGTQRVIASFAPGHGKREHMGHVTIVNPNAGPDHRPYARRISRGKFYRDPYPLGNGRCLVASEAGDLLLMDETGATMLVYRLAHRDRRQGLYCMEPRPLRPRPRERVIPPRTKSAQPTGRLILANIYEGRNMAGVKRGDIKSLLVLETLPKPINFSGYMEPLSYGGTFTLERVLGTVPVEPDGSAFMELPAVRSLFLVALDANGMSVKRMQSFLTVQPGETTSCVGCHEQRTRTPHQNTEALMATRRPPSRIEPITDAPDVFDFPRDIQPILDRHCVACHDYTKTPKGGPRSGGVVLTGDRGPMYSHSYFMLSARLQMADGRNLARSNYPPRAIGSAASKLSKKIDAAAGRHESPLRGHHDVKVSDHERKMIRLWIDSAAAYPGTYAALGTGMIGGLTTAPYRADAKWPTVGPAGQVIKRRCSLCHKGPTRLPLHPADMMKINERAVKKGDIRLRFSRHIVYNLTRPGLSLILLAPLAPESFGLGLCKHNGQPAGVFRTHSDPDYLKLLAMIRDAKKCLDRMKRFDMPGFRPNDAYVREMKRYGILPASFDPAKDPLDVYATDQAYWRSLWHHPPKP